MTTEVVINIIVLFYSVDSPLGTILSPKILLICLDEEEFREVSEDIQWSIEYRYNKWWGGAENRVVNDDERECRWVDETLKEIR